MSCLVNPYRHASSAFNPASLFAGGETGDYWKFDNVHTNATANGQAISTATGLVNGRTLTQATGANQPTLSAISSFWAANFVATNDFLTHALGSSVAQPGTIIMCCGDSSIANTRIFVTGSSSTSRWQISIDSSGNLIMYAGSTLDTTVNKNFGTQVFTAEFNGASSKFRQNGTQVATGSIGAQATDQITIGAQWDGTLGTTLNVYSFLFINRILNSTELDQTERLLGSHAGLTW